MYYRSSLLYNKNKDSNNNPQRNKEEGEDEMDDTKSDWSNQTQDAYLKILQQFKRYYSPTPIPGKPIRSSTTASSYDLQTNYSFSPSYSSPSSFQNRNPYSSSLVPAPSPPPPKKEEQEQKEEWISHGTIQTSNLIWIGDPDLVFFQEKRSKHLGKNMKEFLTLSQSKEGKPIKLFEKDGALISFGGGTKNLKVFTRVHSVTKEITEIRLTL